MKRVTRYTASVPLRHIPSCSFLCMTGNQASKETGIPMATLYYGSDADVQSMEILYDVKFNGDAEPVPDVDMNAVGLEKFNYK